METSIFIAILAGLGGMLGWGLADFFAKKTIDQVGDVVSLGVSNLFGMGALFIVLLIQGQSESMFGITALSGTDWLGLIFFGILQAAVYLFAYKGFGKGSISLLSPVFATFTGLVALVSILVYGEQVSLYIVAGLVVIFMGILVINSDRDTFRMSKKFLTIVPGFKEVGIATLMAALWTVYWDRFVGGENWLLYTFYMYSFMTVAVYLYAFLRRISMKVTHKPILFFIALIGFSEVVAYAAISWGYSLTTHTSIIALLSGALAIPTIILASIFLKERMTKIQVLGVLITIIGIMIISLFNG